MSRAANELKNPESGAEAVADLAGSLLRRSGVCHRHDGDDAGRQWLRELAQTGKGPDHAACLMAFLWAASRP
jgi:hypothetical protein